MHEGRSSDFALGQLDRMEEHYVTSLVAAGGGAEGLANRLST